MKVKGRLLKNEEHFQVQLKNRAHTFRDKTKYTRKEKHKVVYNY